MFPLCLLVTSCSLVALLLRGTSVEYASSGKIRFKYHLAPKEVADDGHLMVMSNGKHMLLGRPEAGDQDDALKEVNLVWGDNHPRIDDDTLDEYKLQGWVNKIQNQIPNIIVDSVVRHIESYAQDEQTVVNNGSGNQHTRASLDKLQVSVLGNYQKKIVKDNGASENKKIIRTSTRKKKTRLKFKPIWKKDVYYNVSNPPELFKTWNMYIDSFCDDQFVGYFNEFAHLHNLVIDKEFIFSERVGGEKLQNVMNQAEEAEYFTYEHGAFEQDCHKTPSYYFNNNNHMNDWLYSFKTKHVNTTDVDLIRNEFVIAIVRYEYVNIYHTMSDWYNAFLMMQKFNKTQWETNVVLIDAHPQGTLDSTWLVLFNSTQRLTMLPKRTLFTNMVWNILGYNSPMLDHYGPGMPLMEEFREFFLTSFNTSISSKLNCAELNILFIWRRDYVAHPRNPNGSISRKILNERELMKSVQDKYPSFRIRGMQIDLFDMQKQLSVITQTDILIGMHGAGLTHAMFLPKTAGVIEMIPSYWSTANDHFYAITKWRNLIYERWSNEDPQNEAPDNFTKIPVGVMHTLIKSVIKQMCYKDKTK